MDRSPCLAGCGELPVLEATRGDGQGQSWANLGQLQMFVMAFPARRRASGCTPRSLLLLFSGPAFVVVDKIQQACRMLQAKSRMLLMFRAGNSQGTAVQPAVWCSEAATRLPADLVEEFRLHGHGFTGEVARFLMVDLSPPVHCSGHRPNMGR